LDSADAFELDARLRRALGLEQRLDAEIAPLLRHVVCAGHEWRVRFQTLAVFAGVALLFLLFSPAARTEATRIQFHATDVFELFPFGF
jgi:hypothetical protein